MSADDLFQEISLTLNDDLRKSLMADPAPCDDCRYRDVCQTEMTACWAYAFYISKSVDARWPLMPRQPVLNLKYVESCGMANQLMPQKAPPKYPYRDRRQAAMFNTK